MIDGNPIEFVEGGFEDTETTEGFAGQETIPEQWAVVGCGSNTEFNYSPGKKTPRVHIQFVLDKQLSGSPGRSYFDDLYLTEANQVMIDGWCKALGIGKPTVCIGETKDGRTRIGKDRIPELGKALATEFKAKGRMIAAVGLEVSKEKDADGNPLYPDRNRTRGWHQVVEDKLEVMKEVGYFDPGLRTIKVRKRKLANGREESYFAVKKAKDAKPEAGAPNVIGSD